MLMVGSNQDFQWRCYTPAEGKSGAKPNARSCLEKQLVMNLPMDVLGLAKPYSDLNAVCVDSSTR